MPDKPILFSTPMIKAILEGRKTQTRRILKPQFPDWVERAGYTWFTPKRHISGHGIYEDEVLGDGLGEKFVKLPIVTRDRLWVRETWRPLNGYGNWDMRIKYAADDAERHIADGEYNSDWRWPKAADKGNVPSIFMPRWASRMTCIVRSVRVERLQSISEVDAIAEGVKRLRSGRGYYDPLFDDGVVLFGHFCITAKEGFQRLWDSINAKRDGGQWSWDANPWVAAVTFTPIFENIDHPE